MCDILNVNTAEYRTMIHDEKWLEEHDEYLDDHEVYAKAYAEHMQSKRIAELEEQRDGPNSSAT